MLTCPVCGDEADALDSTAVHLTDHHGWDYNTACTWLRNEVEARAWA